MDHGYEETSVYLKVIHILKKNLKLQPPTLFNKVVLSKLYIKHNFMITFNLIIFKIK